MYESVQGEMITALKVNNICNLSVTSHFKNKIDIL